MISFFKSKYFLKELIPSNYIDIHNHLLAGIDDGAKTLQDTNMLIIRMKELNIAGAITTPHTFYGTWNNTTSGIRKAYKSAIETDTNRSFLKGYASEYLLDATLIARLNEEPLLCLKDTYVLIELPRFHSPIGLFEMIFEIKAKDYKIIIAHPERYKYFHTNFKNFTELKASGVCFQLDLLSLIGFYGKETQKMAERLLENDMYDFSGTDIHRERHIDELSINPIPFWNKNKVGDLLEKNSFFNSI
jgi:protein-tyrosine phosphatase